MWGRAPLVGSYGTENTTQSCRQPLAAVGESGGRVSVQQRADGYDTAAGGVVIGACVRRLGTAVDDQRVAARIGWRPQQGDFAAVGQVLPRTTPDQADVDHCPGSIGAVGEFAQHRLDCHRVHAMAIIDGDQVSERVVGQGGGQPFEVYLFGTHGFEDRRPMCYSEPTGCPIRGLA